MINLRSGKRLWRPPDSVWDLEWDIGYKPNPEGTWYRVPGTRRWVLLDIIVSVLCNQLLDSMALLGGFSVQYYVSSSVRT
jgi:hypothetical protein